MVPTPPVPGPGSEPRVMFPDLDAAYRRHLEAMGRVRRAVAAAATSRRQLELRLAQIERDAPESEAWASSERTEVLGHLEAVRAGERRVAEITQRFQVSISALQDAKAAVESAAAAADEAARATLAEVFGS